MNNNIRIYCMNLKKNSGSTWKIILLIIISSFLIGCSSSNLNSKLDVSFDGGYGQIEIGGKYVGAEFHHSRPLPSRLSFYYPVANSIVTSADYWHRDKSFPFNIILHSETGKDTLGTIPYSYIYTPFSLRFENIENDYKVNVSYDVCDNLPILVSKIKIQNLTNVKKKLSLETSLQTILRTSHTFTERSKALVQYNNNGSDVMAAFNYEDTDSAVVFIANVGEIPVSYDKKVSESINDPALQFTFERELDADEEAEIIQLIGMCRQNESKKVLEESKQQWEKSINENKESILYNTFKQAYFYTQNQQLMQTLYWSKAVLESNKHYIDGHFMPMPCPAEYNFFFTHDLLLTNLGAVNYNLEYVKKGLQFLHSLTKEDSILAHAYYWKDTKFATEYCNSDNWNNMWIIILASSYLKHSGDIQTVGSLFPIIKKSLKLMLESKGEDDLMYSKRPDWWDIGNVSGARVYNTALMYKTLHDYCFIAHVLKKKDEPLSEYLHLAVRMKQKFINKFWDNNTDYLMNMIDRDKVDYHYYSGSLIALPFGLVDGDIKLSILQTAKDTLLDINIGIRNAMPPDFHKLISLYKFNGMEAGEPCFYFNGSVWPQGNIWYALALISADRVNEANEVIKKYLTLQGIQNSPKGQPSFYECRMTDPNSEQYGEVDKPTFLWAGGWYIYTLYQLAGVRENPWNISFSPRLPTGFENAEYDLTMFGKLCRVQWSGKGDYFKRIKFDGREAYSAIVTHSGANLNLERGIPEMPYLAEANCMIKDVTYNTSSKELKISYSDITAHNIYLVIISPFKVQKQVINGMDSQELLNMVESNGIYKYLLFIESQKDKNEILLYF